MWLKRLVLGTPLEGPARRAHRLFKPGGADPIALINAAYDEQAFAVMRRCLKRDSSCVDVGCHEGLVLKEMLRLAPAGTHYAFEPLPELYQGLLSGFPTVRVFDVALSDSAGEATFQHVTSNPGYSGFRRRRYDRPDETVAEIRVRTARLDDLIPETEVVALIKIDVEGAELQVLRGAAGTIRRCRPVVIFEHGSGGADCYGTTPEQVFDLLTVECGLQVSLMKCWLAGEGPLSREGFAAQFHERINYYFMAHPVSA